MNNLVEKMNETLNEMVYHFDTYNLQSCKMDSLIYKYLDLSEDEVSIESYNDRIEISFDKKPDEQSINKIYELSDKIGTKTREKLGNSFELEVESRVVYN